MRRVPAFRAVNHASAARKVQERFPIRAPFVLSVGDLQPRKNHIGLIRAFAELVRTHPQLKHQLVLAGKDTWFGERVREAARKSGVAERIVFTGFVSDDDLLQLYNACECFAFPSLYEGFGIPVLEAMACGRAVVASNAASIPEVADGAGILFNPYALTMKWCGRWATSCWMRSCALVWSGWACSAPACLQLGRERRKRRSKCTGKWRALSARPRSRRPFRTRSRWRYRKSSSRRPMNIRYSAAAAILTAVSLAAATASPGFPFSDETLNYSIVWPSGLSFGEAHLQASRAGVDWNFDLKVEASLPGYAITDRYFSVASSALVRRQLPTRHLPRREEGVRADHGGSGRFGNAPDSRWRQERVLRRLLRARCA